MLLKRLPPFFVQSLDEEPGEPFAGKGGRIVREINVETLLSAIQDGKPWLSRFTGKEYGKAYQEYQARYAGLFREAVLADGEEGIEALTEVLLDGLAEGWKRQKPWNRSLVKVENRQMAVCYLSPMLLEDPVCVPLAERLRDGWAARWPKDAYQLTRAEKLQKGFRPTFMGIPLPVGETSEE